MPNRAHDEPILKVRDAVRRFGDRTVFRGVTFSVRSGSCCAIVGSNGAGKSTLLRCIVGRDRLDDGRITIGGKDIDESSARFRSEVAAVIGNAATFAHLTVHEHLQLVATAHGATQPAALATTVLEAVGLTHAADHLPAVLSSGQWRRLMLASAFVRPRRLLVLDEPEQHLDHAGREWLSAALRQEKQSGTAVVLVSHDAALVSAVADTTVDGDAWR
ncbi:ABC transporter ATP-binding protein [Nocardia uniformis]|uniref:ABC transporter ATP-binding protein n=1 Tax=Nocardia uniformis TaxID=53432 RepID=A0A849C7L3_9NOCA|nr:ABC transporter ATP-binding protein [Nocardia uniformis]